MRKLLFVPSLAMAAMLAGCASQLLDSQGNPVYDNSGKPVMVSDSVQKKVDQSSAAARESVRAEMDKAVKAGKTPGASASPLTDEKVRSLAGAEASEDEVAALKAVAESEARRYLKENVYPLRVAEANAAIDAAVAAKLAKAQYRQAIDAAVAEKTGIEEIDRPVAAHAKEARGKAVKAWADAIIAKLGPIVEKCVASGDCAKAREALWRASTTGVEDVDALVRQYAVETMQSSVNPSEWDAIEAELKAKVAELEAAKDFDSAIGWLKAFRRVRTYSAILDRQLETVEAELVKVGVPAENIKPIMEATGVLVGEAERIIDMTDVTTNSVTVLEGKKTEGFEPDLEAYREKLEAYRKTLVKYDCTDEAADKIVANFGAGVAPLLAPLSRPGSTETSTETKEFLLLGTGALNSRIDKTVAALVADMEAKKAAYIESLRAAAAKEAASKLEEEVRRLVADGKFAEAREAIWSSTSTEDADMNARIREKGAELMLRLVNPSHWTAIADEFAAKASAAEENASWDEAIAWARAYPEIRTYSASIDERLDAVKDEVARIGVDAESAEAAASETRKAAVEAERLASHIDTVEKTVENGAAPDLAEYEKLLAAYRESLVRNDCTEANADRLVAGFKAKIAPYIELLSRGTENSGLLLGSNAVNDRLARLRAETVARFVTLKYKHVLDDLVSRVTAAVDEGRYADARAAIRDVSLVEEPEWNAKIYATRIGLLDSIVNPAQCAALLAEIDDKARELFEAEKYEEFREYAKNYEYVHDFSEAILDAFAKLKEAVAGLTVAEDEAAGWQAGTEGRVRETLDARKGAFRKEERTGSDEFEAALAELGKGVVAQYYRPDEVDAFCKTLRGEIAALASKQPAPMTTREMNEALAARLGEYASKTGPLAEVRDYAKLLAEIDAEISYDSQIAMAEDAIARQLGAKCPEADLRLNALLGEYARTMRHLKLGRKITREQATVALLGAVCLDQAAVADRALELGADANGATSRDPLDRTGVLLAIQTGHNSFLKRLSAAGASFSVADANGDTALHYAVRRGNLSVVKAMLAKNAIDAANKAGDTALFIAVRRNQAAVAAALVKAKASVSAKNANGETPMDAACRAGSRDVLDVLAAAGAEYGPEQLKIAASCDRLAVAQWLVGKGVDVNAPGVMEATVCKTDTKRYLVREGGIPADCESPCFDSASGSAGSATGSAAPAGSPAKVAEASGIIEFKVTDIK